MADNIVDHIVQTGKDIGEIKSDIKNLIGYVGAINREVVKTRDDLTAHKLDSAAHGIKDKDEVKEKDWSKVMALVMLGITVLEVGIHLFK